LPVPFDRERERLIVHLGRSAATQGELPLGPGWAPLVEHPLPRPQRPPRSVGLASTGAKARFLTRRMGSPSRRATGMELGATWRGRTSGGPHATVGPSLVPHAVHRPVRSRLDVEAWWVGSAPAVRVGWVTVQGSSLTRIAAKQGNRPCCDVGTRRQRQAEVAAKITEPQTRGDALARCCPKRRFLARWGAPERGETESTSPDTGCAVVPPWHRAPSRRTGPHFASSCRWARPKTSRWLACSHRA